MTEIPRAQEQLFAGGQSSRERYSALVVGRPGWGALIHYELVQLFSQNVPGAVGLVFRKALFRSLLGACGQNVVFGQNVVLRHPHKIRIGDNTVIDDYAVLDAKGEDNDGISIGQNAYIGRNTILSCKEGSIHLDDYCNISANCMLLSETEVRLGKYCFLAGNCYLVAGGNHSFRQADVPIMFQPSYSKGGIRIGEDVWLGAGAIVLDGVEIGRGSVVGAGSVLTKALPEFSIAMGSPARRIRDRRTETTKAEP
jgi:acetyltransferase-like isoleucine patch superfamily enzyme